MTGIGKDRLGIGSLSIALIVLCSVASSAAADPRYGGHAGGGAVFVTALDESTGTRTTVNESSPISDQPARTFVEYRWVIICMSPTSADNMGAESDCSGAHVCARPRQRLYRLWGRPAEDASWQPLYSQCFGVPPTDADAPRPQITPAIVLNEIRRIGLPTLQARTQPEGKTLVNFDTIFYTRAQPFSATVTLLGRQVEIVAEPSEYVWHHGDGGITKTSGPGAPYPSKDITYRYSEAHRAVETRVDVTYTARFRVAGGTWQQIPETVSITGPETELRVSEATPVLSGNYG